VRAKSRTRVTLQAEENIKKKFVTSKVLSVGSYTTNFWGGQKKKRIGLEGSDNERKRGLF